MPTPLNTQHSWAITPPSPPYVTNCVQTTINLPCIQKVLPENFSQAEGFKVPFMPIYVERKNFSNHFISVFVNTNMEEASYDLSHANFEILLSHVNCGDVITH